MPWSETTKIRERMRFVLDAEGELFTMTELCERYGISRMTGHKWLRRFRQDGGGGLEDRCRAPQHCPHRTDSEVVEALVEARHRPPLLGGP
jgi:transposase-like protein